MTSEAYYRAIKKHAALNHAGEQNSFAETKCECGFHAYMTIKTGDPFSDRGGEWAYHVKEEAK